MAKFWSNIEKHADTIEKHRITNEEIQFLKNLQHEMNTQNTLGQANPRYWVIRDYEKVYGNGLNNVEGITIYDASSWETVCDFKHSDFDIEDTINAVIDAIQTAGFEIDNDIMEKIKDSCSIESLIKSVTDAYEGEFLILEYQEVPVDKGMFLTHEAAIKHLKDNQHHYCARAHTYAQTAWRSSEEKLWDILQTVDFEQFIERS